MFHCGRISLSLWYVDFLRVVLLEEEQDTEAKPMRTAHNNTANVLNKCERLFIGQEF